MPEMDGYKFLETYRDISPTPVICLSARISEDDQIKGFDLGADDYVTKPFRPRTLIARVHAVLRRAVTNQDQTEKDRLEIGRVAWTVENILFLWMVCSLGLRQRNSTFWLL